MVIHLLCCFFPIMIWLSWNRFSSLYVVDSQFNISSLISSLDLKNLTSLQVSTIKKIVDFLFNNSIIVGKVKFSYVFFIIALIILSLTLYIIYRKKQYLQLFLLFLISNIGYISLLIVLYCYCFSPTEMENLNSFDRYLSSMNIYCILIFFITLFDLPIFDIKTLIILLLISLISTKDFKNIVAPSFMHSDEIVSLDLENSLNYINNYVDENSSVCVFSYYLIDIPKFTYRCNFKCNFIQGSLGELKNNSIAILTKYDYVIFNYDDLKTVDDLLANFSNSNAIYNNFLYKVSVINDEIRLIMMC